MAARRPTKRSALKFAPSKPDAAGLLKQSQSVRFSGEERELINRAALELGISISRLIQDAAVARAVDILNARAANSRLLGLAREVVQWIMNPDVTVTSFVLPNEESEKVVQTLPADRLRELKSVYYTPDDAGPAVDNIAVEPPSTAKLTEFCLALETATTEFANHLIDQLRTQAATSELYRPTYVRPSATEPSPEEG